MNINEKPTSKIKAFFESAFIDIFEQYVTDASFLWVLRSVAVNQPHYHAHDIQELDSRINANLDGLMTSVDLAWDVCLESLSYEQPGEVFTAAIVAFRSGDVERIKTAVEAGLKSEATISGLVSAFGWLPGNVVHPWIPKFFASKGLQHKYIAAAVCSVRRENPGEILTALFKRDDCMAHKKLKARLIRLIGELKLNNLRWALDEAYDDDDPEVKFWVNWSRLLLGDYSAVNQLQSYVETKGSLQLIALQTAFSVLTIEEGKAWISRLAGDPEQSRTVIQAIGVLGDPQVVPWLIEKMREAEFAKLAAEAFSSITGIDLERDQLVADEPDELTILPNDEIDDSNVDLDNDENLPFPDVDKVLVTWQKQGANYVAGQRYFMGQPVSVQSLASKIETGSQRQRYAAALQLALIEPSATLVNVCSQTRHRPKSNPLQCDFQSLA